MDRTEDVIRGEMMAAQEAYHRLMQSDAPSKSEAAKLSEAIGRLRAELAGLLAAGADLCPKCKSIPIGHLKKLVPERVVAGANGVPDTRLPEEKTYEVRCVACNKRAQGRTPKAAVLLWNAGEYTP